MKKWLIKLFFPSAGTLARFAAEGVTKSVNNSKDEVKAKIAKYGTYAEEATRIANKLAAMVVDGTIDKAEAAELQTMITPIFEKVLALV